VRAALTPGPSPALRERGELGREIAPAPLIPPLCFHSVGKEGAGGR